MAAITFEGIILIDRMLYVDVATQELRCLIDDKIEKCYRISTALNGLGEEQGSERTPRGWHAIHQKFGENDPVGTVFKGRRPTGEVYTRDLAQAHPGRDWIITRILWLTGLEEGKNLGGTVDTLSRYIYIHGCPDELELGKPSSHGCVRMHSVDIIDLFDRVVIGTKVLIV